MGEWFGQSSLMNLKMGKGELNEGCLPSLLIGRKVGVMDRYRVARRLAMGEKYAFTFECNYI